MSKSSESKEQEMPLTPVQKFLQAIRNVANRQELEAMVKNANISFANTYLDVDGRFKFPIEVLLEGSNPDKENLINCLKEQCGYSDLHMAIFRNNTDTIESEIRQIIQDQGKELVNQTDKDGWTPLLMAAKNGHEATVRCLVEEFGADVNPVNKNWRTPLLIAAQNGHEAIVRYLVKECGADVNQAHKDGSTPLFIAVQNNHEATVRCLVKECEADVNPVNKYGWTPLLIAARNGHEAIVRYLVKECRADVNQAENSWWPPLIMAAQNGHEAIVRYLVKEFRADVNWADEYGWTPLMSAARNGHEAIVRYLVKECRADVNQANKDGWTPLMGAAQNGHKAIVRCLVKECEADVSQTDKDGWTPLLIAAQNGHEATVRCLVEECGADVNQASKRGKTPLMIAQELNRKNISDLLETYYDIGQQITNILQNNKISSVEIVEKIRVIINNLPEGYSAASIINSNRLLDKTQDPDVLAYLVYLGGDINLYQEQAKEEQDPRRRSFGRINPVLTEEEAKASELRAVADMLKNPNDFADEIKEASDLPVFLLEDIAQYMGIPTLGKEYINKPDFTKSIAVDMAKIIEKFSAPQHHIQDIKISDDKAGIIFSVSTEEDALKLLGKIYEMNDNKDDKNLKLLPHKEDDGVPSKKRWGKSRQKEQQPWEIYVPYELLVKILNKEAIEERRDVGGGEEHKEHEEKEEHEEKKEHVVIDRPAPTIYQAQSSSLQKSQLLKQYLQGLSQVEIASDITYDYLQDDGQEAMVHLVVSCKEDAVKLINIFNPEDQDKITTSLDEGSGVKVRVEIPQDLCDAMIKRSDRGVY